MVSENLVSARAKIDRAKEHLADIDAALKRTVGAKQNAPLTAPYEFDPERKQLVINSPPPEPVEPTLPLLIGDCIHNLRSSLDHLVFQLAVLNGTSAGAESKTALPIYLTVAEFNNFVKNKVAPFVSVSALTAIEELQPYKTGDGSKSILWGLHQLDIIDKHRLLVVIAQEFRPIWFCLTTPTGDKFEKDVMESQWKSLEDGAEMIRFDLSEAITEPGKVNVKLKTLSMVQLKKIGLFCDGVPLVAALNDCVSVVTKIVDDFGKLFFGE